MIVVGGKSLIARHFDRLPALKLDLDYALWLFTVAATLISATSLLGALVIYIIEQIRFLNGLGLAFHGHNYLKMLEIAALFGFAAAGLNFLRIHLNIEPEGFEVEIPSPIIADLPGTQENWRFECVSEMSLLVSMVQPEMLPQGRSLELARSIIVKHLKRPNFQSELVAAIEDPKEKAVTLRKFHERLNRSGFFG